MICTNKTKLQPERSWLHLAPKSLGLAVANLFSRSQSLHHRHVQPTRMDPTTLITGVPQKGSPLQPLLNVVIRYSYTNLILHFLQPESRQSIIVTNLLSGSRGACSIHSNESSLPARRLNSVLVRNLSSPCRKRRKSPFMSASFSRILLKHFSDFLFLTNPADFSRAL